MAVLDIGAVGHNQNIPGGDASLVVIVGNLIAVSATGEYKYKSITVMAGAILTFTQAGTGPAMVWVDDFVLCQGTITTVFPTIIGGPTGAVNWDGALLGGNGSAVAGGGGGGATAGTPNLHQILFNGLYNVTQTDYRYKQFYRGGWNNAGGGGMGWNTVTGTPAVQGGKPGGALIMVARGSIFIDHNTAGTVDCKGGNGTNGVATGAQGGGGGGAGGLVLLISYRQIDCQAGALVTCKGGDGGNGAIDGTGRRAGGGGGGGGGYYMLIAPVVNEGLGSVTSAPGKGGAPANGGGIASAGGGGGGGSFGIGSAGGAPGFPGIGGAGGGALIFEDWSPWLGF